MDNLQQYKKRTFQILFLFALITTLLIVAFPFILYLVLDFSTAIYAGITLVFGTCIIALFTLLATRIVTKPLETITTTISYISHPEHYTVTPLQQDTSIARELITALNETIFQLASTKTVQTEQSTNSPAIARPDLLDGFAIPLFVLNAEQQIITANKAAADYVGKESSALSGMTLFDVLSLQFQNDDTFEKWLTTVRTERLTATARWERVRHSIDQDTHKQFDLVAHFSNGSSSGPQITLALFDYTDRYAQEDADVSFVAMAVHELRTPLTIMRGYIEVFEDELGPTLNPELTDFMHKMHASAQQLTAFVNNILNVARIDENQLALKLREEQWPDVLRNAIENLQLRASAHGKTLELHMHEHMPTVAIDRISILEVINNLVDNAIKYSGDAQKITVTSVVNSEGFVETSVQDYGVGIPASVMPQLFKKYHRSHKSKVQVSGTGLGLYLCKALIAAHGGNIWVHSKEGEGSIFSFTVLPFDKVKQEQLAGEDGIIRGAHGWIKNHSLYRN